jgi:outer membrane protein OmpA-like peptidoglycan-associated protein
MPRLLPALLIALLPAAAFAQDAAELRGRSVDLVPKVIGIEMKTRDLVFRVEDLKPKVADLQIRESKTELRIELAADVLFDFDKADIRPQAADALKQAAALIRDKGKGTVRIEGHTDAKGSDAYNQKLSERRAASVRDWLVQKEGLKAVKFATQGFGARKPVAANAKPDGSDDPEGRQKNRRVEIVIRR